MAGSSEAEKLEAALKKAAHVRPWDIGKGPEEPGTHVYHT